MSNRCTRRDFLRSVTAAAALSSLPTPGAKAGPGVDNESPSLPVAIQRCNTYDPTRLTPRLQAALDGIGGIKELVAGKTVTIKLNLTGGPRWKLAGLPAHRTYHVHPGFVAATCSVLHDAGAKRVVLVESGYAQEPLEEVMWDNGWDIPMINRAGGGKVFWEDTRHIGPWKSYARLSVPYGGYIYPAYDLNMRYEKTDVLVSLAKLKDHANAGVTMSVKNQFGIAPTSVYGDHYEESTGRPAVNELSISPRGDTFHKGKRLPPSGVPQELDPNSSREWSYRVPRVTADLFSVRPPDLCLVDGIETNRGGEGPWIQGVQPITPYLLFAGRNGVCTDAVCTAAMGYDPTADHKQFPFMGDNHLKLLAEKGMGTHSVEKIEIAGVALKDAVYPFNPERHVIGRPVFS